MSLQNTGSTPAAPTPPETTVLVLSLTSRTDKQVQGNADHAKLQKAIDTILADEKRRSSFGSHSRAFPTRGEGVAIARLKFCSFKLVVAKDHAFHA